MAEGKLASVFEDFFFLRKTLEKHVRGEEKVLFPRNTKT